ncbi:MAG: hypothetical protein V7L20_09040 [Nostoc sp.]
MGQTIAFVNSLEFPGHYRRALKNSDFTARLYLKNLPSDQQLFYRVIFQDLDYKGTYSAPVKGTFRTPPKSDRDVFFVWGGNTA